MTDRPNPEGPEQDRSAAPAQAATPLPLAVPVEPVPAEPTPPLPTSTAPSAPLASRQSAPSAPEPEPAPQQAPVQAEPHTTVEPVAEPAAPAQIAPESGAPPIPMVPEPSVSGPPEPVSPEPGPPVALTAETEETLALPPTTKQVEPPPAPSAPPPPTGVPVPFAAPPTMRSANFGLKLGLGIGGGVFAVVAIVVALFAAFFVFANSITEKVEATAEEFVGAVAEDDWDTAYAMLCEDARQRPVEDYVAEWDAWDAEGAEIGAIDAATGNVTVEFDDGSAVELVIAVEQTQETLDTSVCGWSEVPAQ